MPITINGNGTVTGATNMATGVQFSSTVGVTGAMNTSSTLATAGIFSPSTGIAFPASQYSSSDVNTLDDYEEGSWTPGISFGGGTTGITYTGQSGGYIKIGGQVTVWGYLALSSKGSSTGAAKITGFPFTNVNAAGRSEGATVSFNYWGQFATSIIPWGYLQNNATTVYLLSGVAGTSISGLSNSDFGNSSGLYFNCVYSTV